VGAGASGLESQAPFCDQRVRKRTRSRVLAKNNHIFNRYPHHRLSHA
jgi:hypothetical protein